MSLFLIILILLALGAFGGGFFGMYPHTYGIGIGGVIVVVLLILLVTGRL
jgi:hypothetical protein